MKAISEQEDGQGPIYFSFVNGAMIMGPQGKLPPWLALGALVVAGASDIPVWLESNQECTQLIYGH